MLSSDLTRNIFIQIIFKKERIAVSARIKRIQVSKSLSEKRSLTPHSIRNRYTLIVLLGHRIYQNE
jgi:hypothetical protein